jgi:hypothetical protein
VAGVSQSLVPKLDNGGGSMEGFGRPKIERVEVCRSLIEKLNGSNSIETRLSRINLLTDIKFSTKSGDNKMLRSKRE